MAETGSNPVDFNRFRSHTAIALKIFKYIINKYKSHYNIILPRKYKNTDASLLNIKTLQLSAMIKLQPLPLIIDCGFYILKEEIDFIPFNSHIPFIER